MANEADGGGRANDGGKGRYGSAEDEMVEEKEEEEEEKGKKRRREECRTKLPGRARADKAPCVRA